MTKIKLKNFLKKYVDNYTNTRVYLKAGTNIWDRVRVMSNSGCAQNIPDLLFDKSYLDYEVDCILDARRAGDIGDIRNLSTLVILIKEPNSMKEEQK